MTYLQSLMIGTEYYLVTEWIRVVNVGVQIARLRKFIKIN